MLPGDSDREVYHIFCNIVRGVISPLLANIFLNELDAEVEKMLPEYNTGKRRITNPTYAKLQHNIAKAKNAGNQAEIKRLLEIRKSTPAGDPNDPNYRRLFYVRYADDFVRHEARYVHGARAPIANRRA